MALLCPSCIAKPSEEKQKNARINRWIELEARRSQLEYKILLLGTGEAGKSTFLRQVRQEVDFLKIVILHLLAKKCQAYKIRKKTN
jgi:hypothetical protein